MRACVPIIASCRELLSSTNDMNSTIASQAFSSAKSVIVLHCYA
jgi:hypothetical protein